MAYLIVFYWLGLVGVALDGRGASVSVFVCVALAAAAVRHWGGAWLTQKTRQGTGYSEG